MKRSWYWNTLLLRQFFIILKKAECEGFFSQRYLEGTSFFGYNGVCANFCTKIVLI